MRRILQTAFALATLTATARADIVYSSIPSSVPPNVPSLGYEATSTSTFGDAVTLAGTARVLTSATVLMSNWALESTYEPVGTSGGYNVPLTLGIYSLGSSGPNPTVGSLLATQTVNAFVPWRPEASAGCNGGWFAGNNGCYNGLAFTVSFNFTPTLVPDNVIVGLSFNTTDYGANPTHVLAPYDSLNFGLSGGTTIGTDINPAGVEWNTSYQGFLTTGTAGTFGPDQDTSSNGWTGYTPAFTLEAIPEPTSMALLMPAIGMIAARRRRG